MLQDIPKIKNKWSEDDIPSLKGKVILVTGANSGLGYESCRMFAQHGAHVLMACRNQERAENSKNTILSLIPDAHIDLISLDMVDLESVKKVKDQLNALGINTIHVLMNNAGVMSPPDRKTTAQGFELQFGVNHLAHFALTATLLDILSDDARIVNVSSLAHERGDINWNDIQWEQQYIPLSAYAQSKTANILFTTSLHEKIQKNNSKRMAIATHPGISHTNLFIGSTFEKMNKFVKVLEFFRIIRTQSAAIGALSQVYACVSPDAISGAYYGPEKRMVGYPQPAKTMPHAMDQESASNLWKLSEELTGQKFSLDKI